MKIKLVGATIKEALLINKIMNQIYNYENSLLGDNQFLVLITGFRKR